MKRQKTAPPMIVLPHTNKPPERVARKCYDAELIQHAKHRNNIYRVRINADTQNFGGLEWIVDGEIGRMNYPGTWAESTVREYYRNGWNYNDKNDRKEDRHE